MLHQRIVLDRSLGFALAIGTLASSGLGRGFLFGLDQLDAQLYLAAMVGVERIVDAALLGGIEQCTVCLLYTSPSPRD